MQPALPLPEPTSTPTPTLTAVIREPLVEDELVLCDSMAAPREIIEPVITVEPIAEPVRGPSLFDRMAMAARGAAEARVPDPPAEALAPLRRRRLMFGR